MSIRTTITLDDDVFERLKRVSSEKGESFREVVNETLRLGLLRLEQPNPEPPPAIRPRSMGVATIPTTKLGEALEYLEGPFHR